MAAMAAPLAAGWAEYSDPSSGRVFYHNAATGVTQWDRPTDGPAPAHGADMAAGGVQQQPQQQPMGGQPPMGGQGGMQGGPDYSNYGMQGGGMSQGGGWQQQGPGQSGATAGMKEGTVKAWFEEKGFGFIVQNNGDEDVFVHRTVLQDGDCLTQGQTVHYETGWNDKRNKLSVTKLVGATRSEGKGSGKGMPIGGEVSAGQPVTGVVKVWFEEKGFGFLTPSDGSEDIFVHRTSLVDGNMLEQGSPVKYTPQWNTAKNKYIATLCSGAIPGNGPHPGGCGGGFGGKGGGGFGKSDNNWDQNRFQPYGQNGGGGGQMGMQQMGGGCDFNNNFNQQQQGGYGGPQQGNFQQGGFQQGGFPGGQGGCDGPPQGGFQQGGFPGGQQQGGFPGQQGGFPGQQGGFGGQDWNQQQQGGCGGQQNFGAPGGFGGQQDFGGMPQMSNPAS